MIRHLSLKNFKRHGELEIAFSEDVTGVFGPNYTGKSTILYAILYALGGATHAPGKNLARRGSDAGFSVLCEFEVQGVTYYVKRSVTTAELLHKGEKLAVGITAVNAKIEQLIGVNIRQWKELFFAKQKNAHALLKYSASTLHALLRRILGVDDLDKVIAKIASWRDREQAVSETIIETFEAVNAAKDALHAAILAHTARQADVPALKAKSAAASAALDLADEASRTASELRKSIAEHLNVAQEAARARAEAEGNILALRKQAASASAELADAEAAYTPLSSAEEADLQTGDELRKTIERADSALQRVKSKLVTLPNNAYGESELVEQLEEAKHNLSNCAQERAEWMHKHAALVAAEKGSKCPTCKRPFEGGTGQQLELELQDAGKKVLSLNDLHQGLVRLAESLADQVRLARARNELQNEKATQEAEIAKCTHALADLGDLAALREKAARAAKCLETAASLAGRVKAAEKALAQAEQALAAAPATGDVEALKADLARAEQAYSERLTEKEEAQAAWLTLSSAYTAALEAQEAARNYQEKCAEACEAAENRYTRKLKAEAIVGTAKELLKVLRSRADIYMASAWEGFLAQASAFAASCTGGSIQEIRRKDNGDFVFLEEGVEVALEEASGAQEAIIGIAVQVALSSAVPCELQTLLLDEPTADMDPEHSMATMAAIKGLGKQVIFVSHQAEDSSLCSQAVNL